MLQLSKIFCKLINVMHFSWSLWGSEVKVHLKREINQALLFLLVIALNIQTACYIYSEARIPTAHPILEVFTYYIQFGDSKQY